jgi:hypothetical protein
MIMHEMRSLVTALATAIDDLVIDGRKYAQTDHDYRVALAMEIMTQRSKGTPATIMSDICRGKPEIASLRLDRDIAETLYKCKLEAINAIKLQIRVMESQIEREWGRNDN